MDKIDSKTWNVKAKVEKWDNADDHEAGLEPDEVIERESNLLLNEGIGRLLSLLTGGGGLAFNNAQSFLGVGTSTTAAAASQTALQAANNSSNKLYKAMDATFPTISAQTVTFKSTFGSTDANFAWEEWSVAAAASTPASDDSGAGVNNLNRKVTSFGTKSSGATWTLSVDITIA